MINPLPYQPAKIHCPPARDDVLSRGRLNDWLDRATTGRIALVVAEAGFGKTTLLADWARRTPRMTAWYRLEPDDRDWLTFIRHLIASGRELDTEFASGTLGMLLSLGPGGPTQQDLITSLAREIAEFGIRSEQGLTLIFDDYHVVDGSSETDPIVRALLDRTAPGFSVVIASRTAPGLPMGKLRARGGVESLDGDDLCFDAEETERLFRDAYRHPLQPDVIADLFDRTEGWAALLTLVRASLDEPDGPDPRALVAQLSATSGDLYDFLAEEVLAGLPPELQRFLTRVSVLTAVDLDSAMLVDDRPASEIAATITHCESLGLLTRPDRGSPHRFHPLVREFLVARLATDIGAAAVQDVHRDLGRQFRDTDWQRSAWHFVQGNDPDSAALTVDGAVESIIASGALQRAMPFLGPSAGNPQRPVALILRSRLELDRGNSVRATTFARSAVDVAQDGAFAGTALLNLASILSVGGFDDAAVGAASAALERQLDMHESYVAQATVMIREASEEGDLDRIGDCLQDLAVMQDQYGLHRYAGISRLNLAAILLWLGRADASAEEAGRAEISLGGRQNPSVERVAATATRAVALAQLGRLSEAVWLLDQVQTTSQLAREEIALESARIHGDFGSADSALTALATVEADQLTGGYRGAWSLVRGTIALRQHDLPLARTMCERLQDQGSSDAAGKMRGQLLRARVALAEGSPHRQSEARELVRIATAQRSRPGRQLGLILDALAADGAIGVEVERLGPPETFCLSILAEELSAGLDRLGVQAAAKVLEEARLRPDRWRTALWHEVVAGTGASVVCAQMLSEIGSAQDASLLRALSRSKKNLRPHAVSITRRLADHVFVSDLGVVDVSLGGVSVRQGMRRKVAALLCYLASRPEMAATKDEALEALWPDLGPDTGSNSLHQTIYSLRRVFEPDYREGLNAGYVQFDGDVVSLEPRLIDSASRRCWGILGRLRTHDAAGVDKLLTEYKGRYALDFTYEDWASTYRENLHAAVLSASETAIATARRDGDYELAIRLGHLLLAIDPEADAIELELLRAYKASGRHAAAAEQYAHYATHMRDELAVDPVPFEDI